jgi:YVTN family beta-propeller protein
MLPPRPGLVPVLLGAVLLTTLLQGHAQDQPAQVRAGAVGSLERFNVGGLGGWDFLTFDSSGQRLFITRGDRVQVWSTVEKKVVAEIASTPGVHGVALAHELNRGFSSNGRANTVGVFALDGLKITRVIEVGENPDAILYEPTLKRIYAFNGRGHSVSVIDAVGLSVLATVPLDGKPEVAVADGAGHVFVNIEDKAELVVLDQATNRILARWPLNPCLEPTGLAIDVAHRRLFSVCGNNKMVVVDADSGRVVAEAPIGDGPDGVEFDPSLGKAFSANGQGTVTVVQETDAEHFATVATIPTQAHARTLALDPASHRIYLVTASFGPAPASSSDGIRPRPPMLKDSFTVLVLPPQ